MSELETRSERDASIRSISRGLAVLQAVNRGRSVTMMQISRFSNIPYPTAFRIVQTLIDEGMIEREPARKRYRPTALVRTLAQGYCDEDNLVAAARPHIVALCKRVAWPISIATRVGSVMMVRDSTHKLTSLTLTNYAPGYTLPLIECSAGKAYLAYCGEEERVSILEGLRKLDGPAERMGVMMLRDDSMLREIRTKGYATQARNAYTANPGKTSSIAAPIFKHGELAGSIVLIFFAAAMPMARAEALFVDEIKRTADAISAELERQDAA